MPILKYSAIDDLGKRHRGSLNAANESDLEARLRSMNLSLLSYKEERLGARAAAKGITRKDLINLCFHLEQLTRAGVPLLEGLDDIQQTTENRSLKIIIASIIADLEGGKLFSEALEAYPAVFDKVFITLVKAGETTGGLSDIFLELTRSIKWRDELISKTKQLLAYPVIVSVFMFGAIGFMFIYLVPQLTEFLINMGQTLPLQTRALIAISDFIVAWWWAMLGLPIFLIMTLLVSASQSRAVRYQLDKFKISAWVIGPILYKIALARISNTIAMMYAAGIPLLQAIRLNRDISNNLVLEQALDQVANDIAQGSQITAAFSKAEIFSPLVIRMLKIGETTGALDGSLANVSYFYDREVDEDVNRLQTMIEPALIAVMGLMLGFIIISVLGPIYDMIGKLDI
ncbi:MAG: type II secretion system F family protein [Immundisolibacteraceae bacterium]|nr:type II secretion system F family protein [Immundisolibacteraceae bacterium]